VPEELPSPEWIVEALAYGVLLPGFVSACVLILGFLATRRESAVRVVGAVAFASGFLAGYVALCRVFFDKPLLKFDDPWQWLPVWATAAVAADLFDLPLAKRWLAGGALRLLVALAVVSVAADYLVPETAARTPNEAPMKEVRPTLVLGTKLVLAIAWLGLAWVAARSHGGLFPFLLALPSFAGGAVLEMGGSGTYAQLAGLLGGVLLGCAPLAWWKSAVPLARGLVPGVAVVLPGLMLNGYLDSFVPIPSASYWLVALAPLTLAAGTLPPVRRTTPLRRCTILAIVMLLPLGTAVALALAVPKEPS